MTRGEIVYRHRLYVLLKFAQHCSIKFIPHKSDLTQVRIQQQLLVQKMRNNRKQWLNVLLGMGRPLDVKLWLLSVESLSATFFACERKILVLSAVSYAMHT